MSDSRGKTPVVVAIAVDFSDHSDYAIRWYLENVHRPLNQVCLIHVPELYEDSRMTLMSPAVLAELASEVEQNIKNLKDKFVRLFEQQAKITPTFYKLYGKPGEAVVDFVKRSGVTIVVTGTRGQGLIRRTMMGSVSDYVIHHSPVPVLVCRHKEEKAD